MGKYWNNICEIYSKQYSKGLANYGMTLEQNNEEILSRITMLEEELVDALCYCEWIKEKIGERNED